MMDAAKLQRIERTIARSAALARAANAADPPARTYGAFARAVDEATDKEGGDAVLVDAKPVLPPEEYDALVQHAGKRWGW